MKYYNGAAIALVITLLALLDSDRNVLFTQGVQLENKQKMVQNEVQQSDEAQQSIETQN